jgi:hypothetical protein
MSLFLRQKKRERACSLEKTVCFLLDDAGKVISFSNLALTLVSDLITRNL